MDSKHCSGWAGSGIMMTKWKWRDNPKCPRCNVDESTLHVVQCQSGENISQFKESMEPLQTWLEETTSPRIASVICTHMKAYQRNKKVGGGSNPQNKNKKAIKATRQARHTKFWQRFPCERMERSTGITLRR